MKTKRRLFGIYFLFFIFFLLGAITLRTVAAINAFDYKYHYFTSKTAIFAANALLVSTIVLFIIYILLTAKRQKPIPNFASPLNYIPSALLSASLVFIVIRFVDVFNSNREIIRLLKTMAPEKDRSAYAILTVLALLIIVFAILSIAYFVLNTIFIRTVSIRRANAGLAVIVFLALYLVYLYFEPNTPINSPIKITDQLTYAFASVFFLYEVRLSLGREKWLSYIIFGFIAASLAAYSSVPALIAYFIKGEYVLGSISIYEVVMTFTVFIFIALKLLLIDRLTDSAESSFISRLKEAAIKRSEELEPFATEEEESDAEKNEEPDENQISILDYEAKADFTDGENENGDQTENISVEEQPE